MNKCIPLNAETRARTGFSHKIIVDYVAIAAIGAAANGLIQILPTGNGLIPGTGTVPAGFAVIRAAFSLITAFDFSDAGITSMLVEVGDDGDPNRFIDQTEVAVDGTEITYGASKVTTFPHCYLVANGIDLTVTVANGGTPLCSECTSGKLEIYLCCVDLNDLKIPT